MTNILYLCLLVFWILLSYIKKWLCTRISQSSSVSVSVLDLEAVLEWRFILLILIILVLSDDEDTLPIQSHANIDLVTFDSLNSHNIQKLVQERDRLEFGNMRQRHSTKKLYPEATNTTCENTMMRSQRLKLVLGTHDSRVKIIDGWVKIINHR